MNIIYLITREKNLRREREGVGGKILMIHRRKKEKHKTIREDIRFLLACSQLVEGLDSFDVVYF